MNVNYTVRTFAPERWGEMDRFAAFFSASFPESTSRDQRAVSGALNHFRKACVLRRLAEKLRTNIEIDRKQLRQEGYTAAENSSESAAVIENVFTELYSAIDCTRKIIVATHKLRGVPDSTRKLFQRIKANLLDDILPAELIEAFKQATWYERLLSMRDELTHSDLGSCHFDEATGKVSYFHTGLGDRHRALVIEDIHERLDIDINDVNLFLGRVFRYLNSLLIDKPIVQVCGLTGGKALIRELRPAPTITFDSGICLSVNWIEVNGIPTCPLLCGAYQKAKVCEADAVNPGNQGAHPDA
jgi:hypothetical protein